MSRETDALIAAVKAKAPNAVVSGTLGHYVSPSNPCSPHSPGSIHCAAGTGGPGRAVDWGGDDAAQDAAFLALSPYASQLAELIHNGSIGGKPITAAVKNGRWVDGLAVYGSTVWEAHKNHTHSAVPFGVFLTVTPAPTPMFPPVPTNPPVPRLPVEVSGVKVQAGMIPVAALDDQGHGWVSVPGPIDRVLFVEAGGSAPGRDKAYWPPVAWDVNDSGPETIVTIYGQPHQATAIYYKILVEE